VARRSRDRQNQLQHQLVQVERRFQNSPLGEIGKMLAASISEVHNSAEAGSTLPEQAEKMAAYVASVLECLPDSFGDRFTFDAQLIGTLAVEYTGASVSLSKMLVPKPSETWGHQTVTMPSMDGKNAHTVDVLHLPGDDNPDDIDLLEYPFICHELGHNILFRNGDGFIAAFAEQLDAILLATKRQRLGIRGSAKQFADDTEAQVRKFWTATLDQFNWAHEIAVDVVAVWLCGPAYLAALQDVMEASDLNPFQLGQSHPPYDVRARALLDAAGQLGWSYYSGGIHALIEKWSSPARTGNRTNLHVACEDSGLVGGAVAAALNTCRSLSLPLCTAARIQAVDETLKKGEPIDFGTDLLIAAWATRRRVTPAEYEMWERSVVQRLLTDIKV
jgi:hypothetical protein